MSIITAFFENGIVHEYTTAYSSLSIAERLNRTLFDMVRPMIKVLSVLEHHFRQHSLSPSRQHRPGEQQKLPGKHTTESQHMVPMLAHRPDPGQQVCSPSLQQMFKSELLVIVKEPLSCYYLYVGTGSILSRVHSCLQFSLVCEEY
jgi:hypothetical protein